MSNKSTKNYSKLKKITKTYNEYSVNCIQLQKQNLIKRFKQLTSTGVKIIQPKIN